MNKAFYWIQNYCDSFASKYDSKPQKIGKDIYVYPMYEGIGNNFHPTGSRKKNYAADRIVEYTNGNFFCAKERYETADAVGRTLRKESIKDLLLSEYAPILNYFWEEEYKYREIPDLLLSPISLDRRFGKFLSEL